ncbi:hypothetical protein L1987_18021 [Smallanthus sonchifolius]|uniref:Uncharacterized protein n=1 Tax=Smallanthus sonchifolius TaxID=185202 RepID=A0ACB9J0R8_9ASTR|nr:hypothetical protein L1987_18021 [Smallanthus sonchifolius]
MVYESGGKRSACNNRHKEGSRNVDQIIANFAQNHLKETEGLNHFNKRFRTSIEPPKDAMWDVNHNPVGQYQIATGEKQIPCNMVFPTPVNDVPFSYSNQCSLQQNFQHNIKDIHQFSAPIDDLPKFDWWESVQSQSHAAEETSSQNCDFFMDLLPEYYQPDELPPLEQWPINSDQALGPEVNTIITEDAMLNKQISRGPQEEMKCGFDSTWDDYESVLESMQSMTPKALESEKTKIHITCFDDNGSGSRPMNIKKSSGSLVDFFEYSGSGSMGSANIKKPSVSLADSFTASQIKEHLSSFILHKKETLENTPPTVNQNTCQLCFMDKLLLTPAPIYCSSCDLLIKQNVGYYRSTEEDTSTQQHSFCMACFKGSRGATILSRGGSISKASLHKTKNDDEKEDSWVQCDRCQHWQHRICGLYNNETDSEGKAEYVCPKCCLKEMDKGKRISFPETALGAKQLPTTNLSDHIEQRLRRRLKQEREETARFQGIELEKLSEAEGLVVRVMASVDKELEVKKQFRDIFHGQDYPEKTAYRSKRTGGVDLCLFGMYVQEFGSDCDGPNKRSVYISYLDSVKYFEPERKTASGESLRTFVYHEILIGYLEHCKKRSFATCYVWACPPKGEDYIFYCHPKTQKTPQKDELRQWYNSMLKKAAADGIVVDQTNLYDHFFEPAKCGNIKISVARLPYFDGDYWSEAAESISKKLDEEESSGGLLSKLPSKRKLMAMGHDKLTRDALVMQRLGKAILPSKENFMIIRLQHICTYCHEVILSRSRWSCKQCNKIQSCSRCYRGRKHRCHSGKYITPLTKDILSDVPLDTKDNDEVLANNFFMTRNDFLNKCQSSEYQFHTLGHAKYSSMMILYHSTHNLLVQPKGDTCHTQKLTRLSTSQPENERPQNQYVLTLSRALVHANRCKSMDCSYPYCETIRNLICHASRCSIRFYNGCENCKLAWGVLRTHKQICTDSSCRIPNCKHVRKQQCLSPALRIKKIQSSDGQQ